MATIYIDGKEYEVDGDRNLLDVCLSLGLDLPYFCWHPALGSVGACRQCAVKQFKDEEDEQGQIVMACMTPAGDGTRISIKDQEAEDFRAAIIEFLMVNHPHDCPICDEGGECHLQDMTVMTGHNYRRFRFKKRTYRNQYLGPLINHEMNRCIQCYRCVRFYREHAGGDDLDVFGAHDHVYFGRHEDGVLQSEFSGNLVEVCPTGVFTDKTLKQHYTRKWDMQVAPSVCVNCGVGCNTIPGERYGGIRRIRNRYNRQVNGYFLCDRGRYGYEFVNSDRRIRQPQVRQDGDLTPVSAGEALEQVAGRVQNGTAIGIGSPRASLEANFALRALVGADNFYAGFSAAEAQLVHTAREILQTGPARSPSLHDVEQADAVLVLGEDLTNTAPMLALAVRQAARNRPLGTAEQLDIPLWHDHAVREVMQDDRGPLFIATPTATKLDEIATEAVRAAPDDLARLGFAVAHALDANAPAVSDLPAAMQELAQSIAEALQDASRPVIISGTGCGNGALLQAAANVAWALCEQNDDDAPAGLAFTVPEANSLGLSLLGDHPLQAAHDALANGDADTVILLENDLTRRATPAFVDELLDAAEQVVVVDHLHGPMTEKADVIFPAGTFAESDGTLVNNEGRAQRFYQVYVPEREMAAVQESWRWLRDLAQAAGRDADWRNLDDVSAALAEAVPVFAPVPEIAPPAGFRIHGQKIPREPHRYSGRTAMRADISVHEPKPPDDPDSAMSFSMEGFKGQPPPALLANYWAPGWNSVQSLTRFQEEVNGPLRGGDHGQRLIEPAPDAGVDYFDAIPAAFTPRDGAWLVVPLPHIFGSDPLSMHTPGIAELAPAPYLALHPDDAAGLAVDEGDTIRLSLDKMALELPLKLMDSLPRGVAGVPAGYPDLPALPLPAWTTIENTQSE